MNTQEQHTRTFLRTSAILLVLVALAALVLAWRQGAFEDRLRLRFGTTSGANLSKGMAVKYQGFRIGQLRSIDLLADGRIVGELEINERHRNFATQGASIRLSQDNFVTSELQLQPVKDETRLLKPGDEVAFVRNTAVADLEKRVMDKVDPALIQLSALLTQLADPKTGLPATVGALHGTLLQANKTLTTLNQKIADPRMDSLLGNADKVVSNLKTGTDKLGQTLESTEKLLVTAEKTVQTVQTTLVSSQQSVQNINKEISGVLKQSNRLVGDGAELLEDFRATGLGRWLAPRRAPAEPAK
jgi:ABC-type transporter Mla subunit MlaD